MGDVFHYVMRLRGLPYSATEQEIAQFLEIPQEQVVQVLITQNERGQPSGQAYVVTNDQGAAENALNKNKMCMPGSNRYIEIFKSNEGEMNSKRPEPGVSGNWDGVIRLRGLPYRATLESIKEFFAGYDIMDAGVFITKNENGECAGDAYIQMLNYRSAAGAKERNKQEMGGRYIEIFNSSNTEMRAAMIKAKVAGVQPAAPVYVAPSTYGGLKMGGGMRQQRPGPY